MNIFKRFMICILFVIFNFIIGNNGDVVFKQVTVKSISLVPVEKYPNSLYENNYFSSLNLEKRRELCLLAQKNISSPFMTEDEHIPEWHAYEVEGSATWLPPIFAAIKCPTFPTVYLRLRNRYFEIVEIEIIFIKLGPLRSNQEFTEYTFNYEIVKNIQFHSWTMPEGESPNKNMMYSTAIRELWTTNHHLYTLDPEERFNLCFAATRRLRRDNTIFSERFIDSPDFWSVNYRGTNSTMMYRIINCKTNPSVYLRAKMSSTKIDIKIMLNDSDYTAIE